ncbi:hypothetical protein Q757_00445 [Oenococcus alcoholitolerans]|uniref:Sugar ABC transporter permease n=1 Tax=Oenococcus alcoholitolerans TaxID=931074 RepID=A0ABR4XU24_9LACO|nr:hypothetical protein Q757_00445 [Oenococcus alcoholitolerans]
MHKSLKAKIIPYTFIGPAIILLIIFSIIPILVSLIISFTDLNITGLGNWSTVKFIGWSNFSNLFSDPDFLQSVGNTVYYVVIGVPLVVILSLTAALLINYGKIDSSN